MSAIESNFPAALARPRHRIIRHQGLIVGTWETVIPASAHTVFTFIERIGGENGWYFADELWRLRGRLDRAVGGIGLLPRRDPVHLVAGDTFDFWQVECVELGARIKLRSRMRMPGRAWLEFQCVPENGSTTRLRTLVLYEPGGLIGELYWVMLYPFHVLIFDGMHEAIARASRHRAENLRS